LEFRRGFKAEANRIAIRVRETMGLAAIDPVEVCALFEIDLIKLSEVDGDCPFLLDRRSSYLSAVTVPCGFRTAIVHNDAHHPYRRRSNISHELAHCFLGHKCTPPLTPSGERARDGGIEAEANFLAGTLLMTNDAAIHVVGQGLVSAAQGIYGISRPMLDYRLRVSGAHAIHQRGMSLLAQ
jgi:IrrE N-terminal-like domain